MNKNVKPGGIILLGGKSQRMGTDKYLLPFFNLTLIERLIRELEKETAEVILISNEPEKLHFLSNKKYKDIHRVTCALSGLHAGLTHSPYEYNFVLACDLPLFDTRAVPYFSNQMRSGVQAVVPLTTKGYEPLCALYSKNCLTEIDRMFAEKNYAIHGLLDRIGLETIDSSQIEAITHPDIFYNMNTPEEYREALSKFEALNKKS